MPGDLALLPTEAFVLTRVDVPISINELLTVGGLPDNETFQVVYTLAHGGLLHSDDWPRALSPEEISKARAVKAAPPNPVKAEAKVGSTREQQAKVIPAPVEERDEKAELDEFLARLKLTTNYYQMLGLVRPVNDADIKRAYHSLAKRFHPDRFRKSVDDQLYTRVESAFAQIAQAYETLKDKQSRAAYDSKLLKQEGRSGAGGASPISNPVNSSSTTTPSKASAPVAPPDSNSAPASFDAEERFRQGLAALESGNNTLAITSLGEAARLAPAQPRYRAYYGRALAREERYRRRAEAELKAAVTLDADNSLYRVMLAELYLEIGLQRRAQSELEHALSVDPGNKLAQRLLLKLKL
jgi:curved DNA-binding protein CbpA